MKIKVTLSFLMKMRFENEKKRIRFFRAASVFFSSSRFHQKPMDRLTQLQDQLDQVIGLSITQIVEWMEREVRRKE